jgi:hypothetical protein
MTLFFGLVGAARMANLSREGAAMHSTDCTAPSENGVSQFSSVVEQRFCNLSEYITVHQAFDFPQHF